MIAGSTLCCRNCAAIAGMGMPMSAAMIAIFMIWEATDSSRALFPAPFICPRMATAATDSPIDIALKSIMTGMENPTASATSIAEYLLTNSPSITGTKACTRLIIRVGTDRKSIVLKVFPSSIIFHQRATSVLRNLSGIVNPVVL